WGMDVVMVDFAPNAPEVELPFVEACLWCMDLPQRDWGYCVDVMEHIPEERVDDALACIASACRDAYFAISCAPADMGELIGETLHVTVKPQAWWEEKLAAHFARVAAEYTASHI